MSCIPTTRGAWSALVLGAMAAGGAMCALSLPVLAQEVQEERIVDLSSDGTGGIDRDALVEDRADENQEPAAPTYWLGIQGQPVSDPLLRTHLQLAADVGVVVENIVEGSPAAKAGLRVHDIMIAVNGEPLTGMAMLQQAVVASKGKAIDLNVLRLAKEHSIEVMPEERPADIAAEGLDRLPRELRGGAPMAQLEGMLRQLQADGRLGGARLFGDGMVFNGAFRNAQLPNGVQVSIARQNDGPAKISVKRGDETWNIEGDDAEALKQLPDDVRPFVEQLLARQGQARAMGDIEANLQGILPDGFGFDMDVFRNQQAERMEAMRARAEAMHAEAEAQRRERAEAMQKQAEAMRARAEEVNGNMLRRLEEMEKRMQELQQRLEQENAPANDNPAADPTKA
jgi:hypothetical protein